MIVLKAAYGRHYKTYSEALRDWEAGKDFKIAGGPYTSKRDLEDLKKSFGTVLVEYGPNSIYTKELS